MRPERSGDRDHFDAWHDSISVIFDTAPLPDREIHNGFEASVRAYHLGGLVVSQVDSAAGDGGRPGAAQPS